MPNTGKNDFSLPVIIYSVAHAFNILYLVKKGLKVVILPNSHEGN